MILFNRIPVLDKGFIALLYSNNNSAQQRELTNTFTITCSPQQLQQLSNMTLVMKCPLFVRAYLAQFGLVTLPVTEKGSGSVLETYIPNMCEVGSPDTETNKLIADDISRTAEALLINPAAYRADGCDNFISHLILPISMYDTIIAHGMYNQWRMFLSNTDLPSPLRAYRDAVEQILRVEWCDEY